MQLGPANLLLKKIEPDEYKKSSEYIFDRYILTIFIIQYFKHDFK